MSGDDGLMMCQWADEDQAQDRAYRLSKAGLAEREIEVVLAYLIDPAHRFAEDDDTGYTKTAAEMAEYFHDRLVDEYASWEGIAYQWIAELPEPGSAQKLADLLFAVADSHQKSVLHELFDDFGAQLAREDSRDHWWYEPGTGDGAVFCLKRPYFEA
jgi:hypothetical protein